MRDICWFRGTAGHLMKMRDCPSECGTVDTYVSVRWVGGWVGGRVSQWVSEYRASDSDSQ